MGLQVETLYETADYALEIGIGVHDTPFKGQRVVRVRNKLTDIIETEGTQYSSALRVIHQLQEDLDEVRPDPAAAHAKFKAQMAAGPFGAMFAPSDDDILN